MLLNHKENAKNLEGIINYLVGLHKEYADQAFISEKANGRLDTFDITTHTGEAISATRKLQTKLEEITHG